MSAILEDIKNRVRATSEARKVLDELKVRGLMVVNAIDTEPDLTDEHKEQLAVVLGGIATMTDAIEFAIEVEGSAFGLEQAGLLETARQTVVRVDEVFA